MDLPQVRDILTGLDHQILRLLGERKNFPRCRSNYDSNILLAPFALRFYVPKILDNLCDDDFELDASLWKEKVKPTDESLIRLLWDRTLYGVEVIACKIPLNKEIRDFEQEKKKIRDYVSLGDELGLKPEQIRTIYQNIFDETVAVQSLSKAFPKANGCERYRAGDADIALIAQIAQAKRKAFKLTSAGEGEYTVAFSDLGEKSR